MRSWFLAIPVLLIGCVDKEPPAPPTGPTGAAQAPLTVDDVTIRSEAIVERVVAVSLSSQSLLRDSEAWGFIDELLANLGNGDDVPTVPVDPPDLPPQAPEDEELDAEEIAADINEWLGDTVFSDDNLETSNATSATFLMSGEDLCGSYTICEPCPMEDPYCDNNCTEEIDQDCVELIDGAEIRLQATVVGEDGIDLAVLIGPQRAKPVTASLAANSIVSEADLAQVKLALEHIITLVPEEEIDVLARVMQGKLEAALTITGDDSFSASWAVTQAVAIEVDTELGTFELDAGIANPMGSIVVDGLQQMIAFDIDVGAVDVALPWALLTEDDTDVATALFHLAGLNLGATLSGDDDSLTITNIGLGDGASTVKKDNTTLFQLDVNPSAGRHFDLGISATELYDSVLLTVAPELNVVAAFDLAHILDDFPEIESYLWDENYQVRLSGAGGASVVPVPESVDYDGGLHVASGTLTISSTAASAPVTVMAGQCLSLVEPAEGAHPVIGSLAATVCP